MSFNLNRGFRKINRSVSRELAFAANPREESFIAAFPVIQFCWRLFLFGARRRLMPKHHINSGIPGLAFTQAYNVHKFMKQNDLRGAMCAQRFPIDGAK